jgi:uncharacterized protein
MLNVVNIAGHNLCRHIERELAVLLFLGIGLVAGVLSGIFGVGGGVVIVPALILLAGFVPVMATGTSLAALLLPVGALGAFEYYRKGHLDVTAALWISLGLFLGVWFGARLAQSLTPVQLKRSFAIFLVLSAGKMWFS